MLAALLILSVLVLLVILFRPKPDPYERQVTPSYNSRHRGKGQELY
jgi:hypothetical protein